MSFNSGAVLFKDISTSSLKGNDRATELYIIPEGLPNILDTEYTRQQNKRIFLQH